MKVVEPPKKAVAQPKARRFVADLLKDRLDTVDRLGKIGRVEKEEPSTKATETTKPLPTKAPRLVSLDAFRGLTVFLMLIVNNIALDTFTPDAFTHAAWNQGLRLADYVFPWFLLCVGLSIPFSFASFQKKGLPNWRYDIKIIGRAIGLIGLGCLINAAISRQVVFTLGVLQLIGLAYLIAAFAYDLPVVRRAIIATIMLGAYGFAIKCIPFPGYPAGTFEEKANLIEHINRTYLVAYNLDGLFSAIPTAALMIYATLIGDVLVNRKLSHIHRLVILFVVGAVMATAGIVVSYFLPYNKPVWTPSYLLLTGGAGILLLAGFYLFTDALKLNKWVFPLVVLGTNALLAYALPVLTKVMVFASWTVSTPKGNMSLQEAFLDSLVNRFGRLPGGWAYTWFYIGCWWLILFLFYRKRKYLRV